MLEQTNRNHDENDIAAAFFVECVGQIEKADVGENIACIYNRILNRRRRRSVCCYV